MCEHRNGYLFHNIRIAGSAYKQLYTSCYLHMSEYIAPSLASVKLVYDPFMTG